VERCEVSLEQAEAENDPSSRCDLLTFVSVGHFEPILFDFETLDFRIQRSRWQP